jgi:hypothetical protein
VKPDSFAAARVLFGDTADTNNDGIQIDATTGKISITVGGTNTVLSATALKIGQWQHVAVRRTVTTNALLVYVGGVNDTTGTPTQAGALGVCAIGATHSTPARFMDGNLDDLRVYTSALSASDILLLSQGGEPATAPTARWTMDDGPQYGEPSDGDPICTWETRDANRWKFDQATAVNRPTYLQSGQNGKPGIVFDGAAQYLKNATQLLKSTSGTVIVVVDHDNVTNAQTYLASSDEGTNTSYLTLGSTVTTGTASAAQRNAADTADSNRSTNGVGESPAIVTFRSDGSAYRLRINGTNETVVVAAGANNGDWLADTTLIDNTTLGAWVSSAVANYFDGRLYEILCYERCLSDVDLRKVERALASKYGITIAS